MLEYQNTCASDEIIILNINIKVSLLITFTFEKKTYNIEKYILITS